MTGRECYERFVAAMGGGLPPFKEQSHRVQAAWDAVADPSAPQHRGTPTMILASPERMPAQAVRVVDDGARAAAEAASAEALSAGDGDLR